MFKDLRPLLLAVTAVLSGLWLGEHDDALFRLKSLAVLAVISLVMVSLGWRSHRTGALVSAVLVALVFLVSWSAGTSEAAHAFHDCVARGEEVREALQSYRTTKGAFPAKLAQLPIRVPGRLVLPPDTLRYQRTDTGYSLAFSSGFDEYDASDVRGFDSQD